MTRDQYARRIIKEQDLVEILYADPRYDLSQVYLDDPTKHNTAIKSNYSELSVIRLKETINVSPKEWHLLNQQNWYMPEEYKKLDIADWILKQCNGNEVELQRCGMELLEYASRNLLPMLNYLKYLIDTMRKNNIVWGVGRGSSVASFVLYKIGVHRINSIEYDLDFYEFMR